jgi:hypothetical protein
MTVRIVVLCCGLAGALGTVCAAADPPATRQTPTVDPSVASGRQLVLWTSGDREVALKMVFMYTLNCKARGWMRDVRLLVWGPSAKLLAEDQELQAQLKSLKDAGVELYACKACADQYGVSNKLAELGLTVVYAGKMLADLQRDGWYVLAI